MDKSMLEEGDFYPHKTMTPEERLWWYSRYFDVVEVNSSFYAIPSPTTSAAWADRTPDRFLFNVKAYGLLTGHHVDLARVPDALRTLLSAPMRSKKFGRVPSAAVSGEARAWALKEMRHAVAPLKHAGKLGYVLFQLAPWVKPTDEELADLARLPRELPEMIVAVEFRNRAWFGSRTDETLTFSQAARARVRDRRCTAEPAHRPIAACADGAHRRLSPPRAQLRRASQASAGQVAHRRREVRLPVQQEGA
jgi:uncharacterized protein YecE (DUF72 family)